MSKSMMNPSIGTRFTNQFDIFKNELVSLRIDISDIPSDDKLNNYNKIKNELSEYMWEQHFLKLHSFDVVTQAKQSGGYRTVCMVTFLPNITDNT